MSSCLCVARRVIGWEMARELTGEEKVEPDDDEDA